MALGADAHTRADFFSQQTPDIALTKGDETMTIEALQQKVAELEAQLATKTAEADAATAELAAKAKEARTAEVKALFAACNKEFTDEAAAPFTAMDAVQFAAVAATMQELAAKNTKTLPEVLFTQQVAGGADQVQKPVALSITDHYALRKKFEQGV